jgi:mono/diheme cytochrome c family protein
MRKSLKVLAWLAGAFVAVVAVAFAVIFTRSNSVLSKKHSVTPRPVAIPTDASAVDRGLHIAKSRGCVDCHGADLGGAKVADDGAMGLWHGPNLTTGPGVRAGKFTNEDWVRAIRHGVGPDGRSLFLMPSEEYQHMGDEDLGAVIAYIKTVPPVDRPSVPIKLGPIARMLVATGKMKLSADVIDHANVRPQQVAAGVTQEFGRYLAVGCVGCHGPNYSGGKIEIGPPDWPPAANLTPHADARIAKWNESDFINAIRTAKRPDGSEVNPVMPRAFGNMNDVELKALWLFLKSLPPVVTGVR